MEKSLEKLANRDNAISNTSEKINTFFETQIDKKHFSKIIRKLNYALLVVVLRNEDETLEKAIIDEAVWTLNQFADLIDPY